MLGTPQPLTIMLMLQSVVGNIEYAISASTFSSQLGYFQQGPLEIRDLKCQNDLSNLYKTSE